MKRSEMVERLKYFFVSEDWCNEADDDFATEIIDFLVSQGMQPPAYEKLVEAKGIASPSPEMKLFYKMPYNEWEAE
jgi:hypothetical protein